MAREIKFRAKSLKGIWEYGDLHLHCKHPHIHNLIGIKIYIDTNTVGQFTGMKDKNGKEIYDGDIIYIQMNDDSDCCCVICYDIDNLAFGIMDEYAYRSMLDGHKKAYDNGFMLRLYKDSRIFNVIGNIHDNPELLKGGEK